MNFRATTTSELPFQQSRAYDSRTSLAGPDRGKRCFNLEPCEYAWKLAMHSAWVPRSRLGYGPPDPGALHGKSCPHVMSCRTHERQWSTQACCMESFPHLLSVNGKGMCHEKLHNKTAAHSYPDHPESTSIMHGRLLHNAGRRAVPCTN